MLQDGARWCKIGWGELVVIITLNIPGIGHQAWSFLLLVFLGRWLVTWWMKLIEMDENSWSLKWIEMEEATENKGSQCQKELPPESKPWIHVDHFNICFLSLECPESLSRRPKVQRSHQGSLRSRTSGISGSKANHSANHSIAKPDWIILSRSASFKWIPPVSCVTRNLHAVGCWWMLWVITTWCIRRRSTK